MPITDSPEENDKFAKAQRLPYPLLTDANSILRKTFGIPNDLMGLLPGRQTYVIDKNGDCVGGRELGSGPISFSVA